VISGIKLLRNPISVETPWVSEAIGEIPEFCEFKLTAMIWLIQSPLPDTSSMGNLIGLISDYIQY